MTVLRNRSGFLIHRRRARPRLAASASTVGFEPSAETNPRPLGVVIAARTEPESCAIGGLRRALDEGRPEPDSTIISARPEHYDFIADWQHPFSKARLRAHRQLLRWRTEGGAE